MADFILTYSKLRFYPLEPRMEDIKIEDIAHALSLMTRANGHCKHFYSVGQHSINCCKEAKSRGFSEHVQLGCLLHDASESYISDITRPVKRNLPDYFTIEERLQKLIYQRFSLGDLTHEEQDQIRQIDDDVLYYEMEALLDTRILEVPPTKANELDLALREFISVEKEYLRLFHTLTGKYSYWSCLGVDGCKGGWLAVKLTQDDFEVMLYKSIEEVLNRHGDCDAMLIDMPIGLPEKGQDVRPDNAARKKLPGKTSSIFNTPCRQAVYASTYQEANEINRRIMGKGLSAQSFAICGKIKEIDQFMSIYPQYKNKLLESHPELCFAMLNLGGPILENKKTEEGMRKRIELLTQFNGQTKEIIAFVRSKPDLRKSIDDVIDALCLAITGSIAIEKGYKYLPEKPLEDSKGILMQMVYA